MLYREGARIKQIQEFLSSKALPTSTPNFYAWLRRQDGLALAPITQISPTSLSRSPLAPAPSNPPVGGFLKTFTPSAAFNLTQISETEAKEKA